MATTIVAIMQSGIVAITICSVAQPVFKWGILWMFYMNGRLSIFIINGQRWDLLFTVHFRPHAFGFILHTVCFQVFNFLVDIIFCTILSSPRSRARFAAASSTEHNSRFCVKVILRQQAQSFNNIAWSLLNVSKAIHIRVLQWNHLIMQF